jgi:hypothetical protein
MRTSQSKLLPVFLPPAGIQVTGPDVNIADLNPVLHSFLIVAGLVHLHLFDQRLCVTRGLGQDHWSGNPHGAGRAVDLLPPANNQVWVQAFTSYLNVLGDRFRLKVIYAHTGAQIDYMHVEMCEATSHQSPVTSHEV